jgi:hypothetical protein
LRERAGAPHKLKLPNEGKAESKTIGWPFLESQKAK